MTNWNDIFDLYVGKNDYMRDWMKRPFINFDGNVWVTDSYAAIIVDTNVCGIVAPESEHKIEIPTAKDEDEWLFVSYGDLQHAVDMCGTEEVMKETEAVCPECDGSGEVTWEYKADTNHETYEKEYECPVCEGDGKIWKEMPCGQFEPSRHNGVKIGEAIFQAWQMARVLRTMRMLDAQTLLIVSEPKKYNATMFQIKEVPGVKILQMPMADPAPKSTIIELMQTNPATVQLTNVNF